MRILTGRFKGRLIPLVENPELRPTADKVRKAVFDTLQDFTQGKRVLDLYSGTGSLGLEALSQGAVFVRFVEQDKAQAGRIEKTLKTWGLESSSCVDPMDVMRAIDRAGARGDRYQLVITDPPYADNRGAATLKALAEAGIVEKGGFVVMECGKRESMPKQAAPFILLRDRKYGQSRLVFYRG